MTMPAYQAELLSGKKAKRQMMKKKRGKRERKQRGAAGKVEREERAKRMSAVTCEGDAAPREARAVP